jgi:hypothetical protein
MENIILHVTHYARIAFEFKGPAVRKLSYSLCELAREWQSERREAAVLCHGSTMADETNDFFPATSTVGKSFLNLKDGPKEVGIEDVSSMGGDCRNMKMVAFKGGVRERIQTQPARPASNQRHVPNATL